jgi:hypothetical protein
MCLLYSERITHTYSDLGATSACYGVADAIMKDAETGKSVTCGRGTDGTCPSGGFCHQDRGDRFSMCCSLAETNVGLPASDRKLKKKGLTLGSKPTNGGIA